MSENKLALGTVQFGLDYGINNQRGRIPEKESGDILAAAFAAGIDTLDTAGAYGESEKVIGAYLNKSSEKFKIVSKFAGGDAENIDKALSRSLSNTGITSFYGYLLHHFKDYRKNPQIWNEMRALQVAGKIKRIGFSLYLEDELNYLQERKLRIDMIQVPYSIFDRRFEKYFQQLHEAGIEIHTRSVFLQGLVFKKPEKLNNFFDKMKIKIARLRQLATINNITVAGLCLNFALSNEWVDKVIVGVDNLQNLEEIIDAQKYQPEVKDISTQLSGMREDDENIILPFNWKTL